MRKIFTLIISILLLTGCYDNIELDDLAIIGGLGIDYIDNNYLLTYEIYNSYKKEDIQSYTISGKGKTISEAFIDANYKTGKKPFFSQLKIVILSEALINDHFKEIVDYFFRDTEIRDEFQLIVAKDVSPEYILEQTSTRQPIISDLLNDLLNLEKYNNNLATNETFKDNLSKLISKRGDIILNSITINEKQLSLTNSFIFNGYNYKNSLSIEESTIYNMLTKKTINTKFTTYYDDKNISISINSSNTDIDITKDKIIINAKLEGKIIENNLSMDLKSPESYELLNKVFAKIIKEDIINLIKILQNNNSDILNLQDKYYKKYNKDNYKLWTTFDIAVKVDLKINTKGFVFEVNHEK